MTRSRRTALTFALAFAAGAVPPRSASAEPTVFQRCEAVTESGQLARKAGRYLKAQADFRECLQAACPSVMQRDCDAWLREIDRQVPTLVVAVVRPDGTPLPASLEIDGVLAQGRLTGVPVPVDPGEHVITVRLGDEVVRRQVFALDGEKSKAIRVEVPPPARVEAPPPPPRAPERPEPATVSWAPVLLAAASVASFGAATAVGLGARRDLSDLESAPCAATRTCAPSDLDSVRTRFLVTDVLLGVGAVALGAAVVTWLGRPTTPPPRARVTVLDLRLGL